MSQPNKKHEDFKRELKDLLQKYNAGIYAFNTYEDSNEVEITIDIDDVEALRMSGNNGISHYDL